MANYYTHFSIGLRLSGDAKQYLIGMANYITEAQDDNLDTAEERLAIEAGDDVRVGAESVMAAHEDQRLEILCEGEMDDGVETVALTSEETGSVEMTATLIREVLAKFDIDQPVCFEYALTASRSVYDAFGGGAVLITKDEIEVLDSHSWLNEQLRARGVADGFRWNIVQDLSGDAPAPSPK